MSSRARLDDPVSGAADRPGDGAGGTVARVPARARTAAVAAVAAVAVVLTAIAGYRWGVAAGRQPGQAVAPTSPSASASRTPSPAEIYTAVAASVVGIDAVHPGAHPVEDAGTGVIVNADGMILTALHVVNGAGSINVTFADGTTAAATITAADPAIDIATLAPAALPSVVVPAVLGRPDRLSVGDSVMAVGNPLGLTRTATTGVVSGLGRQATVTGGTSLTGLIQFDAAVNPGSSGGPLINGNGQTVGIVVALANPTSANTFIGIGFAVPVTAALTAGGGDRVPQQ